MDTAGKRKSENFEDAGLRPREWMVEREDAPFGTGRLEVIYKGTSRVLAWFYTQRARAHHVVTVYVRNPGALGFRVYATYQPFDFTGDD